MEHYSFFGVITPQDVENYTIDIQRHAGFPVNLSDMKKAERTGKLYALFFIIPLGSLIVLSHMHTVRGLYDEILELVHQGEVLRAMMLLSFIVAVFFVVFCFYKPNTETWLWGRIKNKECTNYSIRDDGVFVSDRKSNFHIPWRELKSVIHQKSCLVFEFRNSEKYYPIPHRFIKGKNTIGQITDFCNAAIAKSAHEKVSFEG